MAQANDSDSLSVEQLKRRREIAARLMAALSEEMGGPAGGVVVLKDPDDVTIVLLALALVVGEVLRQICSTTKLHPLLAMDMVSSAVVEAFMQSEAAEGLRRAKASGAH